MEKEREQARVDVVIPTCGNGALVATAVRSILNSTHTHFTLWVIDQSDDNETEIALRPYVAEDDRVRYQHLAQRGSNLARNMGAQLGTAPYILFTDDDCRVDANWMHEMLRELEDPHTWAVFGRILPEEKPTDTKANVDARLTEVLPVAIKDSMEREVYSTNRFNLGFGHGANMGVRRDAFSRSGGFDEKLGTGGRFRGWPERDFGYRILSRGGQIIYTPSALLYHRHWRTWPQLRQSFCNYGFAAGAVAGKYLRCGDWGGAYLFLEWMFDQGIRPILSGILKWRSLRKVEAGLLQLVYPWLGLYQSLATPINKQEMLFR